VTVLRRALAVPPFAADPADLIGLGVAAERAGFDVIVTTDKNIRYQQNLKERSIALIVLWTNDWSLLKPAASRISAAVDGVTAHSFQMIGPG